MSYTEGMRFLLPAIAGLALGIIIAHPLADLPLPFFSHPLEKAFAFGTVRQMDPEHDIVFIDVRTAFAPQPSYLMAVTYSSSTNWYSDSGSSLSKNGSITQFPPGTAVDVSFAKNPSGPFEAEGIGLRNSSL